MRVACGEHLFFHGPTPNAFVGLAAAAGATTKAALVSSISLAPLYPAALFAKLVASLDRVSGGRFELGLGAGGEYPPEFEAVGVDPASRFRRLEETVAISRLLFAGGPVDFDGEFTRLRSVQLQPGPTRPGGPTLWMAGRQAGALRRVGWLADVWLPYMVTPEKLEAGLSQVRAAAADHGRPAEAVKGAVFAWTCADADGDWARRCGTEMVKPDLPAGLRSAGRSLPVPRHTRSAGRPPGRVRRRRSGAGHHLRDRRCRRPSASDPDPRRPGAGGAGRSLRSGELIRPAAIG